jgi:mannonate dehydratase
MKLGLGLYGNMLTPDNFRFAKQAGATHIVAHIVGNFKKAEAAAITTEGSNAYGFGISAPPDDVFTYEWFRDLKAAISKEGLVLEAIENFEPAHWYDVLLDGPRRDAQMAHLKQILRDMGRAGIPIMGYNFSLAGVWGRDRGPFARAGAESVGFHDPAQAPIPKGMVWNMVYDTALFDPEGKNGYLDPVTPEQFWDRYTRFVREIIPVAEEAGVRLVMHPDDPPLPALRGMPRLVFRWDLYQRLLDVSPSPNHGMEFCIGTLAEMSDQYNARGGFADIYDMIDRYSATGRIGYIHFRNVKGQVPFYEEVFVDEGDVDMIQALRVLHKNGFDGVLIPDHTPQITCAAPWHAGMAYALGFMKAAIRIMERQ